MTVWKKLFGARTGEQDSFRGTELGPVWDAYCAQWPINNEKYRCWKPASILPAPKAIVRDAIKAAYSEWPTPIDWQTYHAFFMEYADVALHLQPGHYESIKAFRARYSTKSTKGEYRDPLLLFSPSSTLANTCTSQTSEESILLIRDHFFVSMKVDHPTVESSEFEEVRSILAEATIEYAAQVQEWRYFILSIGREGYVST